MKKLKKVFTLFFIFFLLPLLILKTPHIFAQENISSGEDIPSDLILDLSFAQQNPAPEQTAILNAQAKQAGIVTTAGESIQVVPKEEVPPEIKTESHKDAVNPDQTTSEQIITIPVTVETKPTEQAPTGGQGEPSPESTNAISSSPEAPSENAPGVNNPSPVPGSTIKEPDDNAAPTEITPITPGTIQSPSNINNPNTPTISQEQPNTQSSTDNSGKSQPGQSSSGSQQPSNNPSPNGRQPQEQPAVQQPAGPEYNPQPPASDNSGQSPANNSQDQAQPAPSDSGNGAVQGSSTGPNLLQRVLNFLFGIFGNNK